MSSELHMICNYKKCKKPLLTRAWVTSCSHAFCQEDGAREFSQGENKCPACKTVLPQKYDIVEVDLNPSEEFKSMVLAGMRIETIFEICNRAVSFWNYQISQQYMFHAMSAKRAKDAIAELETVHETAVGKLTSKLKMLTNRMKDMKEEEKSLQQRIADLNQQLSLKNQQVQKLQNKNTALKQRCASGSMSNYVEDERLHAYHHHHHHRVPNARPDFRMAPRTLVGSDHADGCSQRVNTEFLKAVPAAARGTGFHFEPDIPNAQFDGTSTLFSVSRRSSDGSKQKSKS